MAHRFIDHTADVAAELDGQTPGELFASAARALSETITDLDAVRPSVTQPVTLDGPTLEDLLVDWLNELLYHFEVHQLLFCDTSVTVEPGPGGWHLEAIATGERYDPARHASRVMVKSATYHGLRVANDAGTWRARIVFDI